MKLPPALVVFAGTIVNRERENAIMKKQEGSITIGQDSFE